MHNLHNLSSVSHTVTSLQRGLFVSYCSVSLLCVLVIMVLVWFVCQKLQTWLATCFGPDKKLQPPEPSYMYIPLPPDISQVATFPRDNQIICILLTKLPQHPPDITKLQPTSFRWKPNHSLTLQSVSSKQEPSNGLWAETSYSLYILNTGLKSQYAFSKQEPSYSLHSPDKSQVTDCISLTVAPPGMN